LNYKSWYTSRPKPESNTFDIPLEVWSDGYDGRQFSAASTGMVVATVCFNDAHQSMTFIIALK